MIRPSTLPMAAKCARFMGTGSDDADSGTKRHSALSALLRAGIALPEEAAELKAKADVLCRDLPEDEFEAVNWAAEYILAKADWQQWPLIIEEKRTWTRPDFTEARGTPDASCGPDLFDFKWRRRDYTAQMADYTLAMFSAGTVPNGKPVLVHILFGESKHVQPLCFTQEDAEEEVLKVLDAVKANPAPTPCEYCGWCALAYKCAPHIAAVEQVAKGYSADPRVQSWHPSKMETGEEIAYALWLWRTVLKKWGESIEHHAFEAATKKGLTLSCKVESWELKTKKGKTYCTDVVQAFGLAGLDQTQFMKCCDLRLNTSKKYKDKVGLINSYAGMHGMALAPAKRDLLKKLEPVLKQTKESVSLGKAKSEGEDEESE